MATKIGKGKQQDLKLMRPQNVIRKQLKLLSCQGNVQILERNYHSGGLFRGSREQGNMSKIHQGTLEHLEIKRELGNILGLKGKGTFDKNLIFSISVKAAEETKKLAKNSTINRKCSKYCRLLQGYSILYLKTL